MWLTGFVACKWQMWNGGSSCSLTSTNQSLRTLNSFRIPPLYAHGNEEIGHVSLHLLGSYNAHQALTNRVQRFHSIAAAQIAMPLQSTHYRPSLYRLHQADKAEVCALSENVWWIIFNYNEPEYHEFTIIALLQEAWSEVCNKNDDYATRDNRQNVFFCVFYLYLKNSF